MQVYLSLQELNKSFRWPDIDTGRDKYYSSNQGIHKQSKTSKTEIYLGKTINAELLNQILIYAAAVVVSLIRLDRIATALENNSGLQLFIMYQQLCIVSLVSLSSLVLNKAYLRLQFVQFKYGSIAFSVHTESSTEEKTA